MEKKFLYLVNPISGTRKKPTLVRSIRMTMEKAAIPFEFLDTRADGDYSELRKYVVDNLITDVVICGGDGSVSQVTSFLMGLDINIGIIPLGSGNGLAFAAAIPSSLPKALNILLQGHTAYVDGFFINDKFSCMMCGVGNDAQVAHDFASQKKRGLQTYLRLSAINYFKSKCYPFTISANGETFETDAYFIVVANSNQFGNNVTIAPKASLSDGLLDIVIVKRMNKLVLPFALLNQIVGSNSPEKINNYRRNKNILYFQTAELKITNNKNAPLHIDGEPEPTTQEINFKVIPKAFRLLQPSL
jgi:YegS/Rv2252/BmrU family lipid kinase